MLANLISRAVQPWTAAKYDPLFTPFAPNGAPPQLLARLYREYEAALPGEFVPPQHKHFRAMVDRVFGAGVNIALLDGQALKRVYALYVCCFELAETFQFQLAQWRDDKALRDLLQDARAEVVADLLEQSAAERARRLHYSRWYEWRAADIDLQGATTLELIQQMSPDDWHEIVLRWDWDAGVEEIKWITAQQRCDRATALYALCSLRPGIVANTVDRGRYRSFVRALAARLEGGLYPTADLSLALPTRTRIDFAQELESARSTGEPPWRLEPEHLTHPGRAHAPKYTLADGQVRFHYDHWLAHIASGRKR